MIGTEWVQTVATGIPVYAASGLVIWGQGWLWRRWLWDRHGAELVVVAERLGGPIRPRWAGWHVEGPKGRVTVTGGVRGVRTRIRIGDRKVERDGFDVGEIVDGTP